MESLNRKYANFKNCCDSLGEVIGKHASINPDDYIMQKLSTAGVVKHFELTYETGWKFLKEYLFVTYDKEILSPKAVFRACEELELFPQIMLNELITLADARNETTHIYSQMLAQEVCKSIEKHYHVFGKILEIIQLPLD